VCILRHLPRRRTLGGYGRGRSSHIYVLKTKENTITSMEVPILVGTPET